jgi:hypothetical protein
MRPREEVAVSVYPPVEFPTSICPKVGAVESPVPPYATEMVEEAETTPLIAWSGPVREPMVTPPLKTLEAEYVLTVVVPNAVEKTPVELLYESGYTAESEVLDILLLKVLKSVELRYPLAPVLLWVMVTFPAENTSGAEKVVVATNCGTPLFQVRT